MTKYAVFPILSSATALLSFLAAIVTVFTSPAVFTSNSTEQPDDVGSQATLPPFQIHDDWKDWATWKASPALLTAFPYFKMGNDLDGLPVYYIEFGKWDLEQWAQQPEPEEKFAEFVKYFEQLIRREEKDAGGSGEFVEIIDYEGFKLLGPDASPMAMKLAMTVFSGKMWSTPFLSYGLFVNVNHAGKIFINESRPLMHRYLDKFEVCDIPMDRWEPLLLKKFTADQLVPKLGGSKDWKPAPFE